MDTDSGLFGALAIFCCIGLLINLGSCVGEENEQKRAVAAGVAQYNPTNAVFEYKTNNVNR